MLDVEELDYFDYLQYRRDAFIYKLSQSNEGETYLKNAWRLEQTKPEKDKLRNKFGKGRG